MALQRSVVGVKVTAAVFVCTLMAVKVIRRFINQKRYNLPPGPRGLPLLGYLPFFGDKPPVTFNELRKTYGDVISISMGSFSAIVIGGHDTIKEALVTKGDDFSGRPAFTTARMANEGRNFIFSTFGAIWKMHRRIVINVMNTFSNNPIEDIIRSEADTVVEELLAKGEKGVSPKRYFHTAVSSVIYQLCYGRHVNIRQDEDFQGIMEEGRQFQQFASAGNLIDAMPWLRFIMPWKLSVLSKLWRNAVTRRGRKVEEHEATFDENHLRDITDGLINAGNTLSREAVSVGLDKSRIVESLDSIFGAGMSTISISLEWLTLLMAAFPDIQEKIVNEINSVVGDGRQPTLDDRQKLPYVKATILEMLRFASPVPMTVPHSTIRDTTLKGYDIPQGTVVLVNLFSVSHDKDLWGDPENFRPERFLSEGGESLDPEKADLVVPFSMGRRRCAGEFLARMELFLFFTTIMQRVRFHKPPGAPHYTLDAVYSLERGPVPFEVCVSARH